MVLLFGISSGLGLRLAKRLLKSGYHVVGTYRTGTPELESLRRAVDSGLTLHRLDMRRLEQLPELFDAIGRRLGTGEPVQMIYACGIWRCGSVCSMTEADFDEVMGVGLKAPYIITSSLIRHFKSRSLQMLFVTGLGGEKNAVEMNSLFGICTNGIYTLTRALGMELAGSGSSCACIALGLFDKGQPYLRDLTEGLRIRRPGELGLVVELICDLIQKDYGRYLNGAVLEMADGLTNYAETVRFLTQARASANGEK